ncbi:hypothetical protein Verru16b_02704 [Lacunisphaera limnophila]|uniref:Uncharacterized protein n=1 Tax=Lacunisphaera limnophila TaxID=1838286 RepID=A0A1D8AXL5_9BACT|nr:hypothetical protein [Lacunisphaera limnophila]AOS45620.1 hypothetical protein Verru16b_02704 [Lacunisphaera limnophila]
MNPPSRSQRPRIIRLINRWLQSLKRRTKAIARPERHDVIDHASAQLRTTNGQMEQVFTTLGETFIPLHGRIEQLFKHCENLVAIASGKRDGMTLFQEAVQVLHGPIEYIDYCIGHHARLLELFARTEQRTKAMLDFQHQMESMLAPLTYIEVLIKIESATLEQEQRDTFITVVSEIERLHTLVSETFEQNTALLAQTHATISRVRAKLVRDFDEHSRHTGARRTQIEGAIASLDEQLSNDSRRDVKIQVFSRELTRRVSAIVTAIQTQDIVSQKSGHVLDSLAEMKTDATGLGHLLEVQISQLDQIEQDFQRAQTEIIDNLGHIVTQADEIDRNALTLDEFTQMTASADGMVQQLLDAFTGVRGIVVSTLELTREANAAARPASNIASSLSTTLGDLSINMRLIALNAQVRSLQIDQGTGLELLAARTAGISAEISDVSEQVARDLGELRDDTRECLELLAEFEQRGTAQHDQLVARSPESEGRLHELRDHAIAVMGSIGETAAAIHHAAQQAHATITGMPGLIEAIQGTRQSLSTLLERVGRTDQDPCLKTKEKLRQHAKRYTMASERLTHQGQTAQMGPTGPLLAAPDVDLFVEMPAGAEPVTPPVPEPARPKATPAPLIPAGEPVASLGHNVDLF